MQPPSGEGDYDFSIDGSWENATPKDPSQPSFNRIKGSKEWIPVDPDKKFSLILIRENQPEPEPDLWSLFVTRAKGQPGSVYRVRGDIVNMHHDHKHNVDPLDSTILKDAHTIAMLTEDQAQSVRRFAELESAPSAPDRASAKENTQGWVARLLQTLTAKGSLAGQLLEGILPIVDSVQ